MKLAKYMELKKLTDAQFAELTGISRANISRLRREDKGQFPSRKTMDAIHSATGGKVTANDFWKLA